MNTTQWKISCPNEWRWKRVTNNKTREHDFACNRCEPTFAFQALCICRQHFNMRQIAAEMIMILDFIFIIVAIECLLKVKRSHFRLRRIDPTNNTYNSSGIFPRTISYKSSITKLKCNSFAIRVYCQTRMALWSILCESPVRWAHLHCMRCACFRRNRPCALHVVRAGFFSLFIQTDGICSSFVRQSLTDDNWINSLAYVVCCYSSAARNWIIPS